MTGHKKRLQEAARQIAASYRKPSAGPWKALCKLFLAPRWIGLDVRASGFQRWKRGELAEWLLSRPEQRGEEWGDVGYYVAQTWSWLWRLYTAVTPVTIIEASVAKFERRVNNLGGKRG